MTCLTGTRATASLGVSLGFGPIHWGVLMVLVINMAGITPPVGSGIFLALAVFIEHKMLYRTRGPVPAGEYAIPFGKAAVRRPGRDVTVVALAAMVPRALAAAETLAAEGIEIEVIDPRTLVPFDPDTVVGSVRRTGRLVVMQEAPVVASFGSEIARVVVEAAFDYLEAPIKVLGMVVPFPASPVLEAAVLPSEKDLIDAVKTSLGRD